ncbi:hypothetical protein ACJJIK_12380 [Microbulbifer sp. ZKSA006]|uniref:hypothetical protein n=1 Tax=Microbulbifer sp. ZKSA006 TaxID=3243390 RepID=UPI004039327B
MKKYIIGALSFFLFFTYLGMFFGDLGGVGGYDGVAPKWLYEKVMLDPSYEFIFNISVIGSISSLALALISLVMFGVLIACAIYKGLVRRVKNS